MNKIIKQVMDVQLAQGGPIKPEQKILKGETFEQYLKRMSEQRKAKGG